MRNYEIMFILSTQLSDDEKKAGVTLVEETLTKAGAVELKTEIWGDRKLAYPIKKKVRNSACSAERLTPLSMTAFIDSYCL